MADWKLAGVVPDSDEEEAWSSEEDISKVASPQQQQPPAQSDEPNDDGHTTQLSPALIIEPQSSSTKIGQGPSQSSGPTLQDNADDAAHVPIREQDSPDPLSEALTPRSSAEKTASSKSQTLIPLSTPILGNLVGDTAGQANADRIFGGEDDVEHSANTTGSVTPRHTEPESPAKSRRSLRPRKPIQVNPYLLENARYSKTMKTHGVRPIRLPAGEQAVPKTRKFNESHDTKYNAEESHDGLGGPAEEPERQRKRGRLHRDDIDELAMSPSPRMSSPHQYLRASSEQSLGHTDNTSVNDEEELPDVRDLGGPTQTVGSFARHPIPSVFSTSRKRLKTKHMAPAEEISLRGQTDAWDLPPSSHPVGTASRARNSSSSRRSPIPEIELEAARHVEPKRTALSIAPIPGTTEPIDLTHITDDSDLSEHDAEKEQTSSTESDSEIIRRTGRRIRGVLPASWLRLHQGRSKPAPTFARRHSPSRSPGQPRPGLAVRRSGTAKSAVSTRSFLEQLHEDEEDLDIETHGDLAPDEDNHYHGDSSVDDGASVVEEDFVDWMLPGQRSGRTAGLSRKRRTKQKVFTGQSRKPYRQSKITNSVYRIGNPEKRQDRHTSVRLEQAISPPALSIVDFVEPDAPIFLKVAARAASKRTNLGRSKPLNKSINLGNRPDNLDALAVLAAWKRGKIKASKQGHSSNPPDSLPPRQPLRAVPTNIRRQRTKHASRLSFTHPQKMTRHVMFDEFLATRDCENSFARSTSLGKAKSYTRNNNSSFRQAQLEAEVLEDSDTAFTSRKKMLDLVFRRNRREVLAPTFQLQQFSTDHAAQGQLMTPGQLVLPTQQHKVSVTSKTPRNRKLIAPKHLDLTLPQFTHANDPLAVMDDADTQERLELSIAEDNKISGLGPFGTQYELHFDTFPLPADTFFHHTTLLGDGTLSKALGDNLPKSITLDRPSTSFVFSNHHFHWGKWDDSTSEEVGLLFDILVEQLDQGQAANSITCANHVLGYLLHSSSVSKEAELRPFTQRFFELLATFMDQTRSADRHGRALLHVNIRFLICSFLLLRFSGATGELMAEAQELEDVLKRLATVVISHLLSIGLAEVRAVYEKLQRLAFRERGIRNDDEVIVYWVITIKILESAQISRAGFWDLTCSVLTNDITQTTDARKLERLWRDMFTLLPLGEVSNDGVLRKGMRFDLPLRGWVLPQQILKWVFDSYETNKRQSPGFNEYCRMLLARCLHLISQWGWDQTFGIVGAIFDFFGQHDLCHLRNEEVYKSAQFLENLSSGPCLLVEPEDRCFHIFLKILATAIHHMRQKKLSKQIRNLIARCLPNHNRQYSKEQTIHTHDLASLRNHHDLLCTLFWAAPPEDRRPVELIEKLVQPASSHKEACLINLRAWSQLARFVVASGGSTQDYRPFMSWQNNVFQHVLNQYLSAAADVQHQFWSLAKEDRQGIQQQYLDNVVAANQAAAKDVLHFSVVSSKDVLKHCPSLTSAVFSFNVSQLSKVFNKLISMGEDLDWGILRASFDTIDLFVKRLESAWKDLRQSSSDSISTSSREFEDAVDFLDDKVLAGFYQAVRLALKSNASDAVPQPGSPSLVVEEAIILCARIASILVDGGKTQLRHFFAPGKYNLFEALPDHNRKLTERRFLPLFLATLLKNHIFDLSTLGCDQFDLWISCLVVPFHALRYENHLAETLKSMDKGFMEGATVTLGALPDYNRNRDWFSCGLLFIRRTLQSADSTQRKPLRAKYEKLLKSVMQQIKSDIRSLELNSTEHQNYVSFVREIVGLIKSHGADICSIDPFYYQASAEYSPAKEDPQLHAAGILAYGLRLGEGDMTAAPQLFYYLYNHFKSSLASGQLDAERRILENAMKDGCILTFMLGHMIPAIINASSCVPDIWPLLGVYSQALQNVLNKSCLPREIPDHCIDEVVSLLSAILEWLRTLAPQTVPFTPNQARIFIELMGICNTVRPSLSCWLLDPLFSSTKALRDCVDEMTSVVQGQVALLDKLQAPNVGHGRLCGILLSSLDWLPKTGPFVQLDHNTSHFAQTLIREVQNNWIITSETITAKVAITSSAQPATQSLGVRNNLENEAGVLSEALDGLKEWIRALSEGHGSQRRRRGVRQRPMSIMLIDE